MIETISQSALACRCHVFCFFEFNFFSIQAFEYLHEQDKAEVLFEKKYYNYIIEELSSYLEVIVDESSDGSLNEHVYNVLEVVSVLLDLPELVESKVGPFSKVDLFYVGFLLDFFSLFFQDHDTKSI